MCVWFYFVIRSISLTFEALTFWWLWQFTIIAQQLRRLFTETGSAEHLYKLEALIVTEAFGHVHHNQVHAAALFCFLLW